jgi:hypothetical protein
VAREFIAFALLRATSPRVTSLLVPFSLITFMLMPSKPLILLGFPLRDGFVARKLRGSGARGRLDFGGDIKRGPLTVSAPKNLRF